MTWLSQHWLLLLLFVAVMLLQRLCVGMGYEGWGKPGCPDYPWRRFMRRKT